MDSAEPGMLDDPSEDDELNLDPVESELNLDPDDELDLEPETAGTASNSGTPLGSPAPESPKLNEANDSDHEPDVGGGPVDNPQSPQDDPQEHKDDEDSTSGECSEESFDSDKQMDGDQSVGKSTVEHLENSNKEINSASDRGITDKTIEPGGNRSDDDNEDGDYISDDDDLNLGETKPVSAVKDSVTNGEVSHREHRLSLELRAPHDDHGELDYDEDVDDHDAQEVTPQKADNKEEKDDEEDEKEDGERYSDDDTDGELDDDDDCEEGEIKEVTDKGEVEDGEEVDGDVRGMDPYLNQPLCRFFMRGTCNWGVGCRFLHPGVPTAGGFIEENMGPSKDWSHESAPSSEKTAGPPPPAAPPRTETAWERGLRQAKELRKKSQKRKENEPDFEEKRKNLSLTAQDTVEEEPEKPSVPTEDDNKENIRAEKIQRDPYYDGIFDDMDSFNSKPLVEGWRDGGHYENFEVHWSREAPHMPQMPSRPSNEPYPDFRIPVHERERMSYKDKHHHNKNFRQGPPYERYDKRKEQKYKNKYQEMGPIDPHEKPRPNNTKEPGLARGEEWADPWQRAKSPVRRKNSSSRSRSRGRRYSRSGSHSSSYSSGSYSSRSRSSSYTSRSSYSRSSSGSSRSSSGSRSRSPPLRRRGPPPFIEKKSIPVKPVEKPRSLVTKAGPNVAGRVLSKENLDGVPYGRHPSNPRQNQPSLRRFEGPEKPPAKQLPTKQIPSKPAQVKAPTAKVPPVKPAPAKQPQPKIPSSKQPPVKPPSVQKSQKPVEKSVLPSRVTGSSARGPTQMPPSTNTRPTRNFRFQRRSRSSGSSRSRSYSSSGSSSRSRSRSSSVSSSSSSSSRSADSDNLYGDMGIRRRKPARSPPSQKPKKGAKPDIPRGAKVPPRTGAPPKVTPPNPKSQRAGRHQNTSIPWKPDDKSKSSVVSGSQQSLHSSKDPLKIQGQKSSIKLTLKAGKVGNDSTTAAKKRPSENTDGPPPKKVVKAPVKEPKEPVRLTIPRVDKLIKPSKALDDDQTSAPKPAAVKPVAPPPKPVQPEAPPKPVPVQPPPAPTPAAAPPKKKSTSSRREELLKQLKAVEDAIARKRTKIN